MHFPELLREHLMISRASPKITPSAFSSSEIEVVPKLLDHDPREFGCYGDRAIAL